MKKMNYFGLAAMAALALSSCHKDDDLPQIPVPVNENEVITTVTTKLIAGTDVITLTSRDLDGDGPNAPIVTASGPLAPDTDYAGTVRFLNETKTPAEDITLEIQEENIYHQLFFQAPAAIGVFSYSDIDSQGHPIGLQFALHSGPDAVTGSLIVTLRHEPNKSASGVSGGDINNAGGSTDAQVVYPIQIVN